MWFRNSENMPVWVRFSSNCQCFLENSTVVDRCYVVASLWVVLMAYRELNVLVKVGLSRVCRRSQQQLVMTWWWSIFFVDISRAERFRTCTFRLQQYTQSPYSPRFCRFGRWQDQLITNKYFFFNLGFSLLNHLCIYCTFLLILVCAWNFALPGCVASCELQSWSNHFKKKQQPGSETSQAFT